MSHDYTVADRQSDERAALDELARAAYWRCRDGGMAHYEAMTIGRDDMIIRARVARRRIQAPPLSCHNLGRVGR